MWDVALFTAYMLMASLLLCIWKQKQQPLENESEIGRSLQSFCALLITSLVPQTPIRYSEGKGVW